MPQLCSVCKHAKRAEIDDMHLLQGVALRPIAAAHGVTISALSRHFKHVPARIAQVADAKARETADSGRLLDRVEKLIAQASGIIAKAEKRKLLGPAIAGIRESRYLLELVGRINGELKGLGVGEFVPGTAAAAAQASLTVNLPAAPSEKEKLENHRKLVRRLRELYHLSEPEDLEEREPKTIPPLM